MLYLGCLLSFIALLSFSSLSTNAASGVNFIYPNASPPITVNYVDTVKLMYSTPWLSVNIWVYCLESAHSKYNEYYQTYGNPLDQSGILTIFHIGDPNDLHPPNKKEVGERLALLDLTCERLLSKRSLAKGEPACKANLAIRRPTC